jgi:hypothetical protein
MKVTDATPTAPRSRRSLLAAAAGAVAATVAANFGRPIPAAAASGDPLIVGQDNSADPFDLTQLDGALAVSTHEGMFPAVRAVDDSVDGLYAIQATSTNGTGIRGNTEHGLAGVQGGTSNPFSIGVLAKNVDEGAGLVVYGKTKFPTRSGRATVAAGRAFVDIDLRQKGGLSGTPLCFANLTSHRPGVHIAAVRPNDPGTGRMRIYLNRAVRSNTFVAWFVLS